jgi:HK97 family phage prohead protease
VKLLRIEIRNDSVHIEGYVNVVERDSRLLPSPHGKFIEQVKARTFQRALEKTDNVDLLFNHKSDRKLGSTKEGNVKLWEDSIGLRAECIITDVEVIEKAKNNELRGWSFAFQVLPNGDKWEEGKDGIQRRYLEEITLPEVSILSITPAYIATSIEARGEDTIITEQRNVEESIEIVDNTTKEDPKVEETRENPIDYSLYDTEIELMRLTHPRY